MHILATVLCCNMEVTNRKKIALENLFNAPWWDTWNPDRLMIASVQSAARVPLRKIYKREKMPRLNYASNVYSDTQAEC